MTGLLHPAGKAACFDLQRFVEAQSGGVHERAVAELRSGRKQSHWMWFVFPQMMGLGHSAVAMRYGISGIDEARAYLAHPVLGAHLQEYAAILEALDARHSACDISRPPDDLKLRSSLTSPGSRANARRRPTRRSGRAAVVPVRITR